MLARTLAGSLTDKWGPRWVAFGGFLVVAVSTLPFAFATATSDPWVLGAALFVRGGGLGAVLVPVMTAAYVDLKPSAIAHASMITRIVQQVGGSFATAAVAIALQVGVASGNTALAFDNAFWWLVGITVLAAGCSLMLPVQAKRVGPKT